MTWRPTYEIFFDDSDVALNPDCACPATYPSPAPVHWTADTPWSIAIIPQPVGTLADTVAWIHTCLLQQLLAQTKKR